MSNLLAPLPLADGEVFTTLLERKGVRLERIVSRGQTTPRDQPYDQPHDEWVMLLAGAARLWASVRWRRATRCSSLPMYGIA